MAYIKKIKTEQDFATREEWLAHRAKGIGGSDAAAIIGRNPWMTNVELWEIKTGRKPQEDISDKVCVKYGVGAEEHLRAIFELDYPQYSVYYRPFNSHRHPEYPYMKASLDGWLVNKDTGECGILEIKTSEINSRIAAEKWADRVPENYLYQLLHYFIVKPEATFAVLKAQLKTTRDDSSGIKDIRHDTRHYYISRADFSAEIEELFKAERKFWEYNVLQDIQPALIMPQI